MAEALGDGAEDSGNRDGGEMLDRCCSSKKRLASTSGSTTYANHQRHMCVYACVVCVCTCVCVHARCACVCMCVRVFTYANASVCVYVCVAIEPSPSSFISFPSFSVLRVFVG